MKKTFKKILKEQNGIGLVEVIAALGISVVVITSLLSLTLFSLRTSLQSTLLMEGTKAANTQMELVRAYRDQTTVWSTFVSTVSGCTPTATPPGCYVDIAVDPLVVRTGSTPTAAGGTSILTRFYAVPKSGNTIISITVQSTWSVGGQNKETFVYTDLTNWQQK